MMNELNNFVKLRNLGFNIHLMRAAFRRITKIQDFDHAEGKVKYISGILLNRISNDKNLPRGKMFGVVIGQSPIIQAKNLKEQIR